MYYQTCPYCGSNLDPGEKCACRKEEYKKATIKETECKKNTKLKGA